MTYTTNDGVPYAWLGPALTPNEIRAMQGRKPYMVPDGTHLLPGGGTITCGTVTFAPPSFKFGDDWPRDPDFQFVLMIVKWFKFWFLWG